MESLEETVWITECLISSLSSQVILKGGENKTSVKVPDTERRELAKEQLKRIYELSEWYSGRYMAGKALGETIPLDSWLSELEKELNAGEEKETGTIDHYENGAEIYGKHGYYGGSSPEQVPVYATLFVPNKSVYRHALKDITQLAKVCEDRFSVTDLLKRTYEENRCKQVRIDTGKTLGYSGLRIFLHEIARSI